MSHIQKFYLDVMPLTKAEKKLLIRQSEGYSVNKVFLLTTSLFWYRFLSLPKSV